MHRLRFHRSFDQGCEVQVKHLLANNLLKAPIRLASDYESFLLVYFLEELSRRPGVKTGFKDVSSVDYAQMVWNF